MSWLSGTSDSDKQLNFLPTVLSVLDNFLGDNFLDKTLGKLENNNHYKIEPFLVKIKAGND